MINDKIDQIYIDNYDFFETLRESIILFNTKMQIQEWRRKCEETYKFINNLVEERNFQGEGMFLEEDFDLIFRELKKISRNRALNRTLYTRHSLVVFNTELKRFLFGSQSLIERLNSFLNLDGISLQSASQFLHGFHPAEYPFISRQTIKSLNLPSNIISNLLKSLEVVVQIENRHHRTFELYIYILIGKKIMREFSLENGNTLNDLLWYRDHSTSKDNIPDSRTDQDEELEERYTQKDEELMFQKEDFLRDYLALHPNYIESGFKIIDTEYNADEAGRIDILGKDKEGKYVVVELKRSLGTDSVIGQILGYMGWIRKHKKTDVRGIIIVNEVSPRVEYALEMLKDDIQLKRYHLKFEIN